MADEAIKRNHRREHLDRICDALRETQQNNFRLAVDEPADPFEEAVNDHHGMALLIKEVKDLLKPLEEEEREFRDGLAASLTAYFADKLKTGMNTYMLSNKRKLKYTHKVTVALDVGHIEVARKAYEEADDKPTDQTFDAVLRVKYELAAAAYKKVTGPKARAAMSRMITRKDAAPTIEVD